ncbi:Panacea domain-containing protein [Leifsonia sp. NPDC058194]|uniref:Panacea domain-containing protein n=1 Tax=Leifsonia sp. NPDC058194 TaxID=3346374 RepID=UPI0036DA2F5D
MDTNPAMIAAMRPVASVVDVAEHILELGGEMEASKLHSLVYLSQSWHLAWSGRVLFDEQIEARAEGPIVPELDELLAGETTVAPGFLRNKLRELAAHDDTFLADYFHIDIAHAAATAAH